MRLYLALLAALLASCGGGDWDERESESEATTSGSVAPYNPNGTLVLVNRTSSAEAPAAPAK